MSTQQTNQTQTAASSQHQQQQSQPQQQQQQQQQFAMAAQALNTNEKGGPEATAGFLKDLSLVAEAAKRAQVAVVTRDLENVSFDGV